MNITDTIHLDGEVTTTADESRAEAIKRLITNSHNVCECCGYMGSFNSMQIRIETAEAVCRLEYDAKGVLLQALVGGEPVWSREA
jgi:hypothetical protein